MLNYFKQITLIGCITMFIWWIALFFFKTLCVWIFWNMIEGYVPILQGPISYFGALCLCLLIHIFKMHVNIKFNDK